ncbi:MAG: alanine--tRNA ligase [Acidimicrobiia bacterium]|nr:alanine--tRNA ligase [Acidimicrobiia bacterium]MDH5293602.1 alanine--tRNA ligase [Acidimicrobiia bacterium]
MDSSSIRRTFLDFFQSRGHIIRPSASLIPIDPTLLLTNAGMVPFKPYFLGEEPPPFPRAASVQKSVRTIDIDIIGTTVRHMSFFEMMGNFSFGDYFKADAMKWAFELLTEGYGLDPDRLWYTAYAEDDEAVDLWINHVGAPSERVQRGGKDNFWQMGVPGPCGPCAEIFYDRGPEFGEDGGPIGGGEERFIEIWNLVFMQNIQDRPYNVVGELPSKNIDTGMGLERLAMLLQGAESAFDVDTVRPVRKAAEAFTGTTYGEDSMVDVSLRILADHGRTMTVLIGDQVMPSNEGRGYILRRVIRRAVRHAWQLGGEGLVTPRLVEATVEALGAWYTNIVDREDFITDVVTREEERFRRTLESGHQLLDTELERLGGGGALSGSVAFKLHDTFGFPIELTKEIASERGFEVDEPGFEAAMDEQRQRAKKNWKGGDEAARGEFYRAVLDDVGLTEFVGYESELGIGRVLAIVVDGDLVDVAEHGQDVEIFLDRTPFYAESGGQVGDTGSITTATGAMAVHDVQHAVQGFHGHRAKVVSGTIQVGQDAELVIDSPRRTRIRKSHTGTHVVHATLRDVLGDHAHQAGSLVQSGRLRFDFSHFQAMTPDEIRDVERISNHRLIGNGEVSTTVTSQDEAKAMGALAFFGDKYGETVRVVRVGDFSVEFCGGTHTHTAGEVGPLVILGESSIGSNIRRIEALTGEAAYDHLVDVRDALDGTGRLLRAPGTEVPARVQALMDKVEELESEIDAIRAQRRSVLAAEMAEAAEAVGESRMVVAAVGEMVPEQLRQLAVSVRDRIGRGVVVLGATNGGKGALVAGVTPDLVASGLSAAALISEAAKSLGGGGSRDPELAQAGGPKGSGLAGALDLASEAVGRALSEV